MKEIFAGTLEVRSVDRRLQQGTRGRLLLTMPSPALECAGLIENGRPVRLAVNACDGRVVIRASATRGNVVEPTETGYVISQYVVGTGISARALLPVRIALAAQPGSVELIVPSEARATPRNQVILTRPCEERETCVKRTAGLRGAAYALALDDYRYDAKRKRGARRVVGLEQLIDMLRNAGHRIERIGPRLWKLDGRSATLGDLAEAARRIDADAVLVAEAA